MFRLRVPTSTILRSAVAELRMAGHFFLQKFYVLAAQNHAPYGKIWA